jgi:hypothetical protein
MDSPSTHPNKANEFDAKMAAPFGLHPGGASLAKPPTGSILVIKYTNETWIVVDAVKPTWNAILDATKWG